MAQPALPLATGPRTVTVRVRTLAIAVAVLTVVCLIFWGARYATGMQPLSLGSWSSAPHGLAPMPHTDDALDTGPPVYRWVSGGTLVLAFEVHNSASVPVTVTGVDHTDAQWVGAISGPTLRNATGNMVLVPGRFHAVRIAPDADATIAFVFHANPKAICGGGGVSAMEAATFRFTALGLFHDSQTIPLGDMTASIADRRC